MSLDHSFQTSEKIQVATQKMSNQDSSGTTKKEQILADFEQTLRNTSSRPIVTEEISKN